MDWKLYKLPSAKAQECAGAELTMGPMPERRHEGKVRCNHVWKLLPSSLETGSHLLISGSVWSRTNRKPWVLQPPSAQL